MLRLRRYCLAHHPGISTNITNATHFSTLPTPPTVANHSPYPRWHITNATHAGMSPLHATYVATLAHNTHQHATHANHAGTSPTLVCHPRHPRQHKQNAISQLRFYKINIFLEQCKRKLKDTNLRYEQRTKKRT